MKNLKFIAGKNLIFSILLLFSVSIFETLTAQNGTAEAFLDTNRILIGDQVRVRLELRQNSEAKIAFPQLYDTLTAKIEIINYSESDTQRTANNNLLIKRYLQITCYDSGYHIIPPLRFKDLLNTDSSKFIETNALLLEVQTFEIDTTKGITDIKKPLDSPFQFSEIIDQYFPLIVVALLIIIIAVFVIHDLLKKEQFVSTTKVRKRRQMPHIIAGKQLDELKEKKLWQNGLIKDYHSNLTEIIRFYLQERFNIPALERTSYEIFEVVNASQILKDETFSQLKQILLLADGVKFAKAQPLPDENELSMNNAYDFVNTTKRTQQEGEIFQQEIQYQVQVKERKRHFLITLLTLSGAISMLISTYVLLDLQSDSIQLIITLLTAFTSTAALIGIWKLKRWALHLYTAVVATNVFILLFINSGSSMVSLIIPTVITLFYFLHYNKFE